MSTKNKPVNYGKKAKVPVVMQLEFLECGAACLTMVLAYYGRYITLEQAREDCGVSRDGQNALNIIKAARNYGMEAKGFRMEPEMFKSFDMFPCIIHWGFNHFVVLTGMKNGKAYINDPGMGDRTVSMEEFDEQFTGVVLAMTPSEEFVQAGKPKSVYSFAKKRMEGAMLAVVFVVITTLIAKLLEIINPIFARVFMDRLLSGQNPEWLYPFIGLLILLTAIMLFNSWVNTLCSLRIDGKMAVVGNSSYMWKVLHLPMKFFSQRMAGDIQNRQSSSASIANTLINTFTPLVLDSFMMVFYLFVMIKNSVLLSCVGLSTIIINFILSNIISKKRINISRVSMRDEGKLYGTTTSGIEMIETIKASGAEVGFFEKWAGYQASVNSNEVKTIKIDQRFGLLPEIVSLINDSIILVLGIYLVIKGQFTVGSVMFFQGLLTSFMGPANTLISSNQMVQEMKTEMERIEDVMEYPDDDTITESFDSIEGAKKLSGRVEMRNVTFGYSPLAAPLIENFNMSLEPGSKVAFVGMSGCGKSTLAKLISGLYKPWAGEILFDGVPIGEIDKNVFRGSLAVVDQDITLFGDSIRDNIRMWDKSIQDFEVILAARDAQIYDDIIKRPGGFDYVLDENGLNLSGGQKQRVEIARVLAQDPSVIIMDEATSALDAMTEYNVVKSITDRGISCIVIAHRLSTIRDCDEIIVMDKGVVVDRGTHEELLARGGLYKELVTSE